MGSAGMLPALSGILPDSSDKLSATTRCALAKRLNIRFAESRRRHADSSEQNARAPHRRHAHPAHSSSFMIMLLFPACLRCRHLSRQAFLDLDCEGERDNSFAE